MCDYYSTKLGTMCILSYPFLQILFKQWCWRVELIRFIFHCSATISSPHSSLVIFAIISKEWIPRLGNKKRRKHMIHSYLTFQGILDIRCISIYWGFPCLVQLGMWMLSCCTWKSYMSNREGIICWGMRGSYMLERVSHAHIHFCV